MNITSEQAQELLDGTAKRKARYKKDWAKVDTALYEAAPDLAQTVIDQGKRIEELEKQNAQLRATDTSEWGY